MGTCHRKEGGGEFQMGALCQYSMVNAHLCWRKGVKDDKGNVNTMHLYKLHC